MAGCDSWRGWHKFVCVSQRCSGDLDRGGCALAVPGHRLDRVDVRRTAEKVVENCCFHGVTANAQHHRQAAGDDRAAAKRAQGAAL